MQVVLIPGFWLDSSSWQGVAPMIEQAGHSVLAVTLPGMESVDADRSGITLRDHVDFVVGIVDALDVQDGPIALVGHSGGGAVAHAVVDARPDRIARAVYVDSTPLDSGAAINASLPVVDGQVPLPDWSVFDDEDLVDLDEELRRAFRARAIPTPARVASDLQLLHDPGRYDVPVTVIACEFPGAQILAWAEQGYPQAVELTRIHDVEFVDLPTGHWPQFTRPDDLARAILASLRT